MSPQDKIEAAILGVLLLNVFLLPSYLSLTYMVTTLLLLLIFSFLEKKGQDRRAVKKYVSLLMLFVSLLAFGVDLYYLVRIPYDVRSKYNDDDIRFFQGIGISFNAGKTKVNTLLTFLPKVVSILMTSVLIKIYSSPAPEAEARGSTLTLQTSSRLLNIAVCTICIASCIV